MKASEYAYRNGISVLLRYRSGERALWLEEPNARDDGRGYTINDASTRVDVGDDEDIEAIIADWKHNVEWTAEAEE